MAKAGIVYVGTTDGLATYSDPGGTGRWRRVGHSLEGRAVRALLAADALTLLAAVNGAALRTADGGQSWAAAPEGEAAGLLDLAAAGEPVLATAHGPARWRGEHAPAPGAAALALLAGKQETLIAAIAGGTSLVRSEDGGASWAPVTVEGGLLGGIAVIAPSSYHMDIAWAGTDQGQLLRSDDRGRTWREVGRERAGVLSLAVVRLA
ncbi:MAG TPA: hypothetical protein PKD53_28575 [Chloroflexaceae bacterium]|nr:hypothetical protein [Chloroflexaceae bacterium]